MNVIIRSLLPPPPPVARTGNPTSAQNAEPVADVRITSPRYDTLSRRHIGFHHVQTEGGLHVNAVRHGRRADRPAARPPEHVIPADTVTGYRIPCSRCASPSCCGAPPRRAMLENAHVLLLFRR